MDVQTRNQNYNHVEDFSVKGFDTSFWDNYEGGIPTIVSGALNLNAQAIASLKSFVYADVTFKGVTIPTDPTASDDRVFGFRNNGNSNDGRITFSIENDEFHARVYDKNGTSLFDLEITWDSGNWTASAIDLRILWTEMGVKFFVYDAENGEVCKAQYATSGEVNNIIPKEPMQIVIDNGNADVVAVASVSIKSGHSVN